MKVDFSTRDDGQVDVFLGSDWALFEEALNDSISSLPPRGAVGNGPSTFWIDYAISGVTRARETGDERPFTWGNATLLAIKGEYVVASHDYAKPDAPGQQIPLSEFLAILVEWRRRVIEAAQTATEPLPDLYRRNPPE